VKDGEYSGSIMYSCENGTMRSTESVLRRGRIKEKDGGGESN
jgi:hypothetical protein